MNFGKLGLFLGGALFGSAGIAVLTGEDAKKAYTHCTAAVLRGKDYVMKTAANVKENCGDIYADARDINEKRYAGQKKKEIEQARAVVALYESENEGGSGKVTE